MADTTQVAPFESCIGCYRGDTSTGVGLEGSVEFTVAGVARLTGMPYDEAKATVFAALAEQGSVRLPIQVIRLCPDCAAKSGAPVGDISAGEFPVYRESEMFPKGGDA